jgi:hypothetical protein
MEDFFNAIAKEFTGFWGLGNLLDILKSGNYSKFLTYEGVVSVLVPLTPLVLLFEIIRTAFYKRFKVIHYKISFFTYVLNAFVGRVIAIAMVGLCIKFFLPLALFNTTFTWYWFIYGYM